MLNRILVAYDGSLSSISALKYASDLADRYDADLHLLGVVHATGTMAFDENGECGTEKDHIEQAMNVAAIELREQGLDVAIETRLGDPASEIISYVAEIQADLAVVGHTGKGIISRWLEGSVGTELVNYLPCHLLITAQDA